tara:strand:- start:102 stop:530 length:429 start_codon:yes stop_codon:yes gene_type:complete
MNTNCPVITLDNGLRIANWSSPHPFKFNTGEVLPACEPNRAKSMSLKIEETEVPYSNMPDTLNGKADDVKVLWNDIRIKVSIPDVVHIDLMKLQRNKSIDIILVPFMLLSAMSQAGLDRGKCRVIRVADRVTKEIHPDRFCI